MTEESMRRADMAMAIFERMSPHQMAVELAEARELLGDIARWVVSGDAGKWAELIARIDAQLQGVE